MSLWSKKSPLSDGVFLCRSTGMIVRLLFERISWTRLKEKLMASGATNVRLFELRFRLAIPSSEPKLWDGIPVMLLRDKSRITSAEPDDMPTNDATVLRFAPVATAPNVNVDGVGYGLYPLMVAGNTKGPAVGNEISIDMPPID